ncbi:NAD(P)/FAD-dependent oxidoreductase [Puniceibacterium confluentis]|uniref:NAD(P)/FAD-dependent oxidoreductase n=1 Tax=Puniceibacterium confluentis TaxID=1958944 RepID=UPI0011B652CD|nr:FAD-dependent oxidoreductase [Puniceibacterium confluentis]
MASIDVTVRGAGIFGLSVAWACVARGARVRLVDPFGAGSGASGGIVGALSPHVPENWNDKKAFQRDSLLMAEEFWSRVETAGGTSAGYGRLGRLQPVSDARTLALAHDRAVGAQQLWLGQADWRVVPAVGGWAPMSPTGLLIHDTLSAHLHPRRAVSALVAALMARGVSVAADGADAGAVVWATGWRGFDALSQGRARPLGVGVKGQAVLLRHAAAGQPQLFVDGLHVIPHLDGTVAVGSTSEREFDAADTVDAQCDALLARAVAALPVLAGAEVVERWAGVRPRARSRAPMLGHWPGRPGHFVANGGFKIGFGMAPKVAEVMADLVLEGRDAVPEGFRVEASF